jgi:hypothetical protein
MRVFRVAGITVRPSLRPFGLKKRGLKRNEEAREEDGRTRVAPRVAEAEKFFWEERRRKNGARSPRARLRRFPEDRDEVEEN